MSNVEPVLSHAEPVLPVADVAATIHYWQHMLGFPDKWMVGDPPVHGGVGWNGAFLQFTLDAEKAAAGKGNSVWIRVVHLDTLFALHKKNNVEVVAEPEMQPWGMKQYSIRDINGYYIHFAEAISDRENSGGEFPNNIKIEARIPTAKEFCEVLAGMDAGSHADEATAQKVLDATVTGSVAIDTTSGNVIGCALLVGDNVSYYYVKNVMIHPQWQGRKIGTALMKELMHWIDANVPKGATVSLISAPHLENFYQQFGFGKVFAMLKQM